MLTDTKIMNDSLGDRIKKYEDSFRSYLPPRTNTIIRCDGRAFHSYTKDCKKPFDDDLMQDMNSTAAALCEEIQGAKFAYVQSDEISIFVTDYDGENTTPWFGGNIQKMCSISASVATAYFNHSRFTRNINNLPKEDTEEFKGLNCIDGACIALTGSLAFFDSRCFIIPSLSEVANYFLWRCNDASRNSVQMVARSLYSHNECENKNSSQLQEMIFQKEINWNNYPAKYKRGRLIVKVKRPDSKIIGDRLINFERNAWESAELPDYNFDYWFKVVNDSLVNK